MTSTTLFKLSDAVKQNYKLKRPLVDQYTTYLKNIKDSDDYLSDTEALQAFLKEKDIHGFVLYIGLTTEREIRVTISVEKQRVLNNRKNLNKLNDQI
ncbi:hypothetical protein JTF04_02750 [Mammaliicoccus vitulinus]|uniref:hypothetical protein n=1 Tax=Mammaliicoccus vitulinus TaxID=71237 RepID=UPI0019515027|nr:hypothetical protein [Mammaliicoccus vitulinus]MBM6628588.1 hypothetical protein [Mammaliicoccus vitulinus]